MKNIITKIETAEPRALIILFSSGLADFYFIRSSASASEQYPARHIHTYLYLASITGVSSLRIMDRVKIDHQWIITAHYVDAIANLS